MRSLPGRVALPLISLLVVLGAIGGMGWFVMRLFDRTPQSASPGSPRQGCLATAGGTTAHLTPEQSKWASVIVAESIRRNLPPRAATIALATAMQESSLRNIDHGDRDSVGLFQQRPSQGWGTVEQIMDPWYSSGKFYDHLVKVKDWQTGDINDVAQKVQRSGVPDGYRKHVEEAKALASVLTGHSPAGLSCVLRESSTPEPSLHEQVLTKGLAGKVTVTRSRGQLVVTAKQPTHAWAAAHLMMANARDARVTKVSVAGRTWQLDPQAYAKWTSASSTGAPHGPDGDGNAVATITLG